MTDALPPLFMDLETYFDKDVSLSKLSVWEYVTHAQFEPQTLIYAEGEGEIHTIVFDPTNGKAQLRQWLAYLNYDKRRVVAHNGMFDFVVGRYCANMVPGDPFCTMLADTYHRGKGTIKVFNPPRRYSHNQTIEDVWQTLHCGNGQGVREAKDRKGLNAVKGSHPAHLATDERALYDTYCMWDVHKLREIYRALKPLPPIRQYAMRWCFKNMLEPVLKLDTEMLYKYEQVEAQRLKDTLDRFNLDASTFRSSAKFADVMDSVYPGGWPRVPSPTNPNASIPLASKANNLWGQIYEADTTPADVKELMDVRQQVTSSSRDKRYKRYANIGAKLNGWFPLHLVPSGAHTHRLTGGSGSGGNPLNWVKGSVIREAVHAPPGYKLICADYTGAELRIARWIAHDRPSMEATLNGEDLYIKFYCETFGVRPEDVSKEQRQIAKIAELSFQFGVGVDRAAQSLGIDEFEARRLVTSFRNQMHPMLPVTWNILGRVLKTWARGLNIDSHSIHHHLNLPPATLFQIVDDVPQVIWPSGTAMTYPNLTGEEYAPRDRGSETRIYGALFFENIVQSLSNEVIWHAQSEIERQLGLRVPYQCYDELVVLAPEDRAWEYAGNVRYIMEESYKEFWPNMPPMEAEPQIVDCYAEAK